MICKQMFSRFVCGEMNSSVRIAQTQQAQAALNVLSALQLTAYLWPKQAVVKDGDAFDYIIVGAGSAGCVLANRLTEDPDISVLLIEAGGGAPLEAEIPILFPFLRNSSYDWNYPSINDHRSNQFHTNMNQDVTRGKMLGGSSAINYMLYMRGNYRDYDGWAELTGDNTWKWENVLPYFKRSERLEDPEVLNSRYGKYHNTKGLLGVTKLPTILSTKYLRSFAELNHTIREDVSGEYPLGFMRSLFTIADKSRQSTARSFLTPAKERCNLHVLMYAMVKKVILDENLNAVGVEVIVDDNKNMKLMARKEVIVSAGAIASPQILMLSGIGPKAHLKSVGIDAKVNLPVGEYLQDHVMGMAVVAMGKADPNPKPPSPYEIPGDLFAGWATLDKSKNVPQYLSFNLIFNDPTLVLDFCLYFGYEHRLCDYLYDNIIGRQVMHTFLNILYPKSRGRISLKSSNIKDYPNIYTGAYSVESDLDNHAAYLQDFLRVLGTKFFKKSNAELIVPDVCGCDGYEYGEHEFFKCFFNCSSGAGYHYTGSCRMGDVVDSRLRVLGVNRLRVVDASVIPKMPGSPTNAPTIMVAEKAADFIKDDYYMNCD